MVRVYNLFTYFTKNTHDRSMLFCHVIVLYNKIQPYKIYVFVLVTEYEVEEGIMKGEDPNLHALLFLRSFTGLGNNCIGDDNLYRYIDLCIENDKVCCSLRSIYYVFVVSKINSLLNVKVNCRRQLIKK